MIEFDEDLYPTDESIEAMVADLAAAAGTSRHRLLARELFDEMVRKCFYCSGGLAVVDVRGEGALVYEFHTGGWSGCETFIYAMMAPRAMVWMLYFERQDSGGHYYLDLATGEEKARWITSGEIAQTEEVPVLTDVVERRAGRELPWARGSGLVFAALVAAMLALVFAMKWNGG
jgi:hypothetical protein